MLWGWCMGDDPGEMPGEEMGGGSKKKIAKTHNTHTYKHKPSDFKKVNISGQPQSSNRQDEHCNVRIVPFMIHY